MEPRSRGKVHDVPWSGLWWLSGTVSPSALWGSVGCHLYLYFLRHMIVFRRSSWAWVVLRSRAQRQRSQIYPPLLASDARHMMRPGVSRLPSLHTYNQNPLNPLILHIRHCSLGFDYSLPDRWTPQSRLIPPRSRLLRFLYVSNSCGHYYFPASHDYFCTLWVEKVNLNWWRSRGLKALLVPTADGRER